MPGSEHLLFIPGVMLIGMVLGYVMGSRAARQDVDKKRRRARE